MPNKHLSRSRRGKKRKKQQLFISMGSVIILLLVVFLGIHFLTPEKEVKSYDNLQSAKQKKSEQKSADNHSDEKQKKQVTKPVVNNQEIDNYLKRIGFSGTALIIRNGKTIINKGYLQANRAQKINNTPDTLYYIGSAQKAFTATAILQLEEKGKLNINDPISKYFPHFPNGQVIKLKNLLNHTSGIVGHTETPNAISPKELVEDIEKQGIKRQPGRWDYKDSNYTVLSYLVEKITGMKLEDYLQKYVFKPAGMTQVGFYKTFNSEKDKSTGYYIKKDGEYIKPSVPDLSQLYGAGNMYLSAQSMYLFDKAIMERKLFSEASFEKMFTKGSISGYGMGFYNDPGSYNSHGVMNGWNVSNSFSHSGKTYVVLFSNIQNNIKSFGKVNNQIYMLLNKADAN